MVSRRDLVVGVSAGCLASLFADSAAASTARAVTVTELVLHSKYVLVGTVEDAESRWENLAGTRRIVTYNRVSVTKPVDGRPPADPEVMVRTLGGQVGHIGQIVHGEAQLERDRQSLLFLQPTEDDAFQVVAMAQGHYPIRPDANGILRLLQSAELPELIDRVSAAVHVLPGRTIPQVEQLVVHELKDAK